MKAAWILAGTTASGKTAVANELARRTGRIILSADSMLVYREMNIGTAKPSPYELQGIVFRGADLASPDEPFSTGMWLEAARKTFAEAEERGTDVIVAGGTGLYISALLYGLDAPPPPSDGTARKRLEQLFKEQGNNRLKEIAETLMPGSLSFLDDPSNPRRLIRHIEKIMSGWIPDKTKKRGTLPVIPALCMPPEVLSERIRARAERMFTDGLPDEMRAIMAKYPALSATAAQSIGYAEAADYVNGLITREEAIERISARTRRLAKKQRTWLRTQLTVCPVDAPAGHADIARAADDVQRAWDRYGPAYPVFSAPVSTSIQQPEPPL